MNEEHHPVVRNARAGTSATVAQDWAALANTLSENVRIADRRRGLQSTTDGKVGVLEVVRVVADLGVNAVDVELVASRGQHTALLRLTLHAGDFEVVMLNVISLDDEGRALRIVFLDEDALVDGPSWTPSRLGTWHDRRTSGAAQGARRHELDARQGLGCAYSLMVRRRSTR